MTSSLMDLPVELLTEILERVGGRELRRGRGTRRLSLCRTWFAVAQPIYLSGFGTTDIRLYGHDINRITGKLGYSGLRPLMHKNTRVLRIRLLGHPWDQNTARVEEDGECPSPYLYNYPPPELIDQQVSLNPAASQWRNLELRNSLDDLFSDIRNFEALETLRIEAGADRNFLPAQYSHGKYLHGSTMSKLMMNLPFMQNLVTLTMDTFSTDFIDSPHICDELALVIPHVKTVRLRMKHVCPKIFSLQRTQSSQMEFLAIKLRAPPSDHGPGFGSLPCPLSGMKRNFELLEAFAKSTPAFLVSLTDTSVVAHQQKRGPQLRISYSTAIERDYRILDGLTLQTYSLRDGWPAWNDDGTPAWFEFRQSTCWIERGLFEPLVDSRWDGRTGYVAQLGPLTSTPGSRAELRCA